MEAAKSVTVSFYYVCNVVVAFGARICQPKFDGSYQWLHGDYFPLLFVHVNHSRGLLWFYQEQFQRL